MNREELFNTFISVTGASTAAAKLTARNILEATDYDLEQAINLYLASDPEPGARSEGPSSAPSALRQPAGESLGFSPPHAGPSSTVPLSPGVPPQLAGLYGPGGEEAVRAPIPTRQDQLYSDAYHMGSNSRQPESHDIDAFRDFKAEQARQDAAASSAGGGLAHLFKAPADLLFHGNFDQAKSAAANQHRWLSGAQLANVQSNSQFASHQLNRDTWSNEMLKDIIKSSFVFWQVSDSSDTGGKIMAFYRLYELPVTMVLDPVTGAKMRDWTGFVEPDRLLEDLVPFMDRSILEAAPLHKRRSVSMHTGNTDRSTLRPQAELSEDEQLALALAASAAEAAPSAPSASPVLPKLDAPITSDKALPAASPSSPAAGPSGKSKEELVSILEGSIPEEPDASVPGRVRVAVRLTTGSRIQRFFPPTATVRALHSYCCLQVPEALDGRAFGLAQSIPGGSQLTDMEQTLQEAQVNNAVLVMRWLAAQ